MLILQYLHKLKEEHLCVAWESTSKWELDEKNQVYHHIKVLALLRKNIYYPLSGVLVNCDKKTVYEIGGYHFHIFHVTIL